MSETILVTGGCGFIGCNFVRMILTETEEVKVINLDALTYAGNPENLADLTDHPNYSFIHGRIQDSQLIQGIFKTHHIDGVINFAAESHVDRSITDPGIFIETNVTGTLNLLHHARVAGVNRFLQVSTDEVYGSLGAQGLFSENSPIQPNSPYSASKASADHLVRAYHHTYGMDTVITRCSNNYGPYQFPEKLIPLIFNNARRDKSLPVYGDGMQVRDWLYVYDHCTALRAAYQKGKAGEVYNIGGCNEMPNLTVVREILAYLKKPESLIEYVTDRPGHDRRYAIDAGKTMRELGWSPTVTFKEGLCKTLDWYSENDRWMNNITSGTKGRKYGR